MDDLKFNDNGKSSSRKDWQRVRVFYGRLAAAGQTAAAELGHWPGDLKPAAKTGTLAKLIENAIELSPTT